jgi:hypothetical protein
MYVAILPPSDTPNRFIQAREGIGQTLNLPRLVPESRMHRIDRIRQNSQSIGKKPPTLVCEIPLQQFCDFQETRPKFSFRCPRLASPQEY